MNWGINGLKPPPKFIHTLKSYRRHLLLINIKTRPFSKRTVGRNITAYCGQAYTVQGISTSNALGICFSAVHSVDPVRREKKANPASITIVVSYLPPSLPRQNVLNVNFELSICGLDEFDDPVAAVLFYRASFRMEGFYR